jgi:hypothetical protein
MKAAEKDLTWLKDYLGLLDTCDCRALIQEIETHVIINKEPFLRLKRKDIDCFELEHFLRLDINVPTNKKFDLYFHLGDAHTIDFKIERKHIKQTLEDKIYKDIRLTLVY